MMPEKYISKKSYGEQYFIKNKQRTGTVLCRIYAIMELVVRFELTRNKSPVYKTGAIGHYATPA